MPYWWYKLHSDIDNDLKEKEKIEGNMRGVWKGLDC